MLLEKEFALLQRYAGVDRLRGLGNAIVPQIAEWIGRQIVEDGGVK